MVYHGLLMLNGGMVPVHERQRQINLLDYHWGEAYDLAVTRSGWVAKRLDNNRALVASSPEELRELIIEDYAAEPVSRDCCPDH